MSKFWNWSVALFLVACGGKTVDALSSDEPMGAGESQPEAGEPVKKDAQPDVHVIDASSKETSASQPEECTASISPFTQVLCYGTSRPDSGTSYTGDCDAAANIPGCMLVVDPAGANPPVWCCP